jgi:citrate lyase subunit beta / citryl-CoA lyase
MRVQRSVLILPVNVLRFVEKSHLRGADVIVLDLEDSVPLSEKDEARKLVREAVAMAARGGVDVMVRINNEPDHIEMDLDSCVISGVHAVFVPKTEDPKQVEYLEKGISALEKERGLDAGSIRLSLHVENPKGILGIAEVVGAGKRIESVSLGVDDYCLNLGVEPSENGEEIFLPLSLMVLACKAGGVSPIGILGSVAGFRDIDGFERAAERGRNLGCIGGLCIHPNQVPVLNRVFSPSPAKIEHAFRVVAAFEEGLKKGRASVSLDNRMVDTPIYKQAKLLLGRSAAIDELEKRKAEALLKFS